MHWFKPHPEKHLRQQMLEARDNLLHQIDVLQGGALYPGGGGAGAYMQAEADGLKVMLEEIETELARTESDDAQGS